jgi:hypothetical protein
MFYEIAKLFAENCEKWMNSIRNILSPTSSAQNTLLFVLAASKKCSFSTKHPTFCSNEPENSLLRINGL